jgi:hypothetical protein
MNQPSPKQLLSMLQLLADVVSLACEELEAIMQEINTEAASSTLQQGQKPRVNKKGRRVTRTRNTEVTGV